MQKLANSVFGNEAMRFVKESDIGGEHIAFWESWKKDDEGNAKLRVQVTSSGGRLKEVKIIEAVDGKAIVTRFDPSYKLHGWEQRVKTETYEKLTEQQRKSIPEFLRSIIPAYDIRESPKEVFYPHFLKDEVPQKKELSKPAPYVFKETRKITQMKPGTLMLHFPEEVANKMGLRGGVQGAWAKEGESITLTPLEGVHYPVKISRESLSLTATIPQEIALSMKLKQGMRMEMSHDGKKIEVKEAEGAPTRTRKIRFTKETNNFRITIPERIAQNMNLNVDRHGEWFSDGEKLSLELVDNAPFIRKIQQNWYPYTTNANSTIPQELADSIGLKKDMSVSFRINDKGQLVISPVVITPSEDVSLQGIPETDYRRIYLTNKVASELHLTGKMSCRWDKEGDSLVMIPLKERSIPREITASASGSLEIVIPGDMQLAVGLRPGDSVKWMEEEGKLTLKKANLAGMALITSIRSDGTSKAVDLPSMTASELQLEGKRSCTWELEGKVLVMTPLEGTITQTKIMKNMSSLRVMLPKEALFASGLKAGEYALFEEKDGMFYLTKAEKDAPGARKVSISGNGTVIDIPKELVSRLDLKDGMYCVWRSEGGKAVVEFSEENPLISKITSAAYGFSVFIPSAIEEFRKGDYILMQVKDGKLYLRRQEDFPKERGEWLSDIEGTWLAQGRLQTTIPQAMAEKLSIEKGMYGLWTFDRKKLWLEPMCSDMHIRDINMTPSESGNKEYFWVVVPYEMTRSVKDVGELIQEVKDGKLYLRKKQESTSA